MTGDGGKFRLQLLGPFGLFDPAGMRIEIRGRKEMALVALLAASPDGVCARGWLQGLLWGRSDDEHAQASLRRVLSDLRKVAQAGGSPLIDSENGRAWINFAHLDVDIREPAGRTSGRLFLEGLDVRGADAFEDWLREQRGVSEEPTAPVTRGAGFSSAALWAPPARRRPSIAVLRFGLVSTDQDEADLADGLAEDLIGGLSKSRLLVVCSRHSSLSIDAARPAGEICTQLDVDYTLQGSVRRAGDMVRVSVALVNGRQDRTIWSAKYDRHISDLLVIQDQITGSILATLEPALLGHEESRSLAARPRELSHWDLLMLGRWHFWRATFPDWEKARKFYARALELAPQDAPTRSHLSLCMLGEIWGGAAADPEAQAAAAYQTALDAVSIDGSDAYGHYVLGTIATILGRFDQAAAEQHRAREINPYLAAATGELGRLALFDGRLDEAFTLSDQAIAASPNDPHLFVWFRTKALASFIAGRYEEAIPHAAAACARSPHQFFLHYLLAACHAAVGDRPRALRALQEGQRLLPGYSEQMIGRAMPFTDATHLERYLEALWKAGWGREIGMILPMAPAAATSRVAHVRA